MRVPTLATGRAAALRGTHLADFASLRVVKPHPAANRTAGRKSQAANTISIASSPKPLKHTSARFQSTNRYIER